MTDRKSAAEMLTMCLSGFSPLASTHRRLCRCEPECWRIPRTWLWPGLTVQTSVLGERQL